uniref:Protein SPIRAL1-like 1 n=1 Tax=Tanacetum cinerariifolium TaxID=118510 RepID=A0A699II77_TANCI|nr:protein SPIRAL1-like 1 [Tanacetum cinerariifolium]
MNQGVSIDGGQSSLNYLFGGGEAPKPALKATQAAPYETPAANNVSAAKPDLISPPVDVTKQIPVDEEVEEEVQNESGDLEDYLEDDHEVNCVQTETDIGSTSHGTSVTRKESRALNEAKKRRVDKGKVASERYSFSHLPETILLLSGG